MNTHLNEVFESLAINAKDLYHGTSISELFAVPTALEFTRDFVAKNLPVIIRGACANWEACTKWNSQYFRSTYGDKKVQIAVTPNGLADGLANKLPENTKYFVLPEEQIMTFAHFLDQLDELNNPNVLYLQKQNSNLNEDFPELLADIDMNTLNFAKESFNKSPEAINFWLGEERAITSMHKDPFENIYCVIDGYKDFILISPTDYPFVPRAKFPSGTYKTGPNRMFIEPNYDANNQPIEIDWVEVDPMNPDYTAFPQYKKATKFKVRLNKGDMLYLPSLWYHHVQQGHKTIAVNFWYDMDYDSRYCYYKMVEELCTIAKCS